MWWFRYRLGVTVTDAAVVVGAAALAPVPLGAAAGLGALWFAALGAGGARDPRWLGVGDEEYRRIVTATLSLTGLAAAVSVLALAVAPMRQVLLVVLPVGLGGLVLSRWLWRQYVHARRARSGDWSHRVLVTGSAEPAAELSAELTRRKDAGFVVVASVVVEPGQDDPEELARAIVRRARRAGADVIAVAAGEAVGAAALRRLGWLLEGSGLQLVVAPGLTAVAGPRVHVRPIAGLPLLCIEEPVFSGAARIAKRLFDTVAAAAGLVVTAPLMALVATAVWVDDRGPVLFRQTRVGRHGKPFTMVKFRTMVTGAERQRAALAATNESDGPLFKIRADPRLTRVGGVLRRCSLDELPQLVNVLFGRMSLVGPRPPLPEEVLRYAKDTRRRLLVPPGLTGLWQISGRSNLSWSDGIALDLHYVDNWSFTTDLVILWKTARAVVTGTGAY